MDQYQSSLLVLSCDGGSGQVHVDLTKAQTVDIAVFPAGMHDVFIGLSANVDLDVQVLDSQNNFCAVGFGCWAEAACRSESDFCYNYRGMEVYFSGDDDHVPVNEMVKIRGELTRTLKFDVLAWATGEGNATYSYSSFLPCPDIAPGCTKCEDYTGCLDGIPVCNGTHHVQCMTTTTTTLASTTTLEAISTTPFVAATPTTASTTTFEAMSTTSVIAATPTTAAPAIISTTTTTTVTATTTPATTTTTSTTTKIADAQCAVDQYQSSLLVLNCNGGSGHVHVELSKAQTSSIANFPAGVIDIHIGLIADVDLDVRFVDAKNEVCAVGFGCLAEEACTRESDYCHNYHGMKVYFSGDDDHVPVSESIKVRGGLTRPMRFDVLSWAPGTGNTTYSYSAFTPCPEIAPGCTKCEDYTGCEGGVPLCNGSPDVQCVPATHYHHNGWVTSIVQEFSNATDAENVVAHGIHGVDFFFPYNMKLPNSTSLSLPNSSLTSHAFLASKSDFGMISTSKRFGHVARVLIIGFVILTASLW
jgi:hypothetical protein